MSTNLMDSRRAGFALPMAILAIGFMSAALVAAFSRLGAETRTVDSTRQELMAFALAQAGLEAKIAANDTTDSTRYTYGVDGRADVRAIRMRSALTNGDTSIWLIKSTGVTRGVNAVMARRTVAQLVYRLAANIQVASAWTSLTGMTKNGGSGKLAGADNCGAKGSLAGIAVPTGGYSQDGGSSVPTGSPPIAGMGTQDQMKDSIKIDWDGIVNQGAITPDIVIPPGNWPVMTDPNYWPIIYIDHGPTGTVDIPEGRGMLIIEGNATMGGSRNWDGIILVGGSLRSDGNNTVLGATISGLNVKLGMTVPTSDVGNGTKTFQYDSCNVDNALKGLGRLNPFQNAWLDNYSAWE